ncbi:MAG TPA: NADPH-dependent FMN reductase [Chitinophagaceae bacterium]|nr:NADPH-dependent FMN reductase [Chitinophagaceae bacterium]
MEYKQKKQVLAISGSTRQNSTNRNFINAITAFSKNDFNVIFFDKLSELPHFNPDSNIKNIPKEVIHFKKLLNNADGVIICTPEYAHGVPGTLKNAIDWTISTNEFVQKPTMLITASTDGQYGHKALLEILRIIETKDIDQLHLLIQFAKTKINSKSEIIDEKTLIDIKQLIRKFTKVLIKKADEKTVEN